jgi:hypothetical protein
MVTSRCALTSGRDLRVEQRLERAQGRGDAGLVVEVAALHVPGAGDDRVGVERDEVADLQADRGQPSALHTGSSTRTSTSGQPTPWVSTSSPYWWPLLLSGSTVPVCTDPGSR